MKKQILLLAALAAVSSGVTAQKKDFGYKFYGQVRTDLFYNSRSNSETVDGLFYMYPNDVAPDANGEDLNAKPDGNFYTLYTRLGLDVNGPMLGKAKTSAKVEVDFRGSGTTYSLFRIRHVYFNLDWGTSALLVGQTWHPLYGDVAPEILNLNMGAPYQPFSRAPQIRYRFTQKHWVLTAAAIWQSQYLSVGPSSNQTGNTGTQKHQQFIKNSCVPEFYVGADYKSQGLLVGAGVHVSSIAPRKQSEYNDAVYKVSERITGVSGEAHVKYTYNKLMVAAKTVLSSNLTQTSTIGGYGITSVDTRTGEQEYTPLRVSHTWLSVMYGKKWRGGIFAGYLKNLGAKDEVSGILGTGTKIDQLGTATAELTYNLPNWKFGAEYSWTGAAYGTNTAKGRVTDTHLVKNNRIVFTALFQF
ncbi:hypothetical protein [Phocaeicola faecium]|uniref:Outer membrane protein n=1 Tax=Phocaeicola faecium TaxID=2762213 RepID=A0ABR8VBJ7_9BACT|nr:hypothetical protein [Phocaeicola faecium]MBD8002062.1 hypothetical protein [Phocaeicola faecium]